MVQKSKCRIIPEQGAVFPRVRRFFCLSCFVQELASYLQLSNEMQASQLNWDRLTLQINWCFHLMSKYNWIFWILIAKPEVLKLLTTLLLSWLFVSSKCRRSPGVVLYNLPHTHPRCILSDPLRARILHNLLESLRVFNWEAIYTCAHTFRTHTQMYPF